MGFVLSPGGNPTVGCISGAGARLQNLSDSQLHTDALQKIAKVSVFQTSHLIKPYEVPFFLKFLTQQYVKINQLLSSHICTENTLLHVWFVLKDF